MGGRGRDSALTLFPEAQNLHLVQEAARVTSEPRLSLSHSPPPIPPPRPSPAALWGMGAEAASFPRPGEGQRLWAGHGLPAPPSPELGAWAGGEAWAGGRGSGQDERTGRLRGSGGAPLLAGGPVPPGPVESSRSFCGTGTTLCSPACLQPPEGAVPPTPQGLAWSFLSLGHAVASC